jgi:hypothetical protein
MPLLTLSFVGLMFITVPGRPEVQDACTFIPRSDLEKLVGHELREGKAKDASPGLSQCGFEAPPDAYVTRRFENPPLPAAANFGSLTVTTFPTTVATFAQSRKTMQANATDIPGIGDSAFLNGPAMIFVRVGARGFSIRVYVDTPATDAGQARLREVMLSLARAGVTKLK